MDMLKRSKFDKLLDKATSELLIDPDLEYTLTACDLIRAQEVSAKSAVSSVRKRLQHDNPNVVLHTLFVLESMMKNCGASVHDEVASSEFMQTMKSIIEKSYDLRSRVLTCIQNWAFAFKDKPKYIAIHSMYDELKGNGYTFPALSETTAMFSVDDAPEWKEEATCHRCKVTFTTFRRRHHCRNCGNSFCADCSNERMVLPKYGIEKEVRVCDHCLEKLKHHRSDTPVENEPTKEHKTQQHAKNDQAALLEKQRKERELESLEAEELQLALALSASEAECKELERRKQQNQLQKYEKKSPTDDQQATSSSTANNGPLKLLPVLDTSDMDPELARYLNRHYWENRASASGPKQRPASPTQPSAPIYATMSPPSSKVTSFPLVSGGAAMSNTPSGSGVNKTTMDTTSADVNASNTPVGGSCNPPGVPELTTPKQEEFLNALRGSIEFFINRLQSNSQRGRSIASDTTVQTLFLTLHEMHPQLLQMKQSMEQRRGFFEDVQDKLTQLREAREALDALRQEHVTRRLLEEQEAARMRQLQMMQKLEMMRQQKRDTLEYRRHMALQQTMHYEQQYQASHFGPPLQNPPYGVDPATGLPFTGGPTTANMYPPGAGANDYQYHGYGAATAAPSGYPMGGGGPTNYPPGVQMEPNYHMQPTAVDHTSQGYYNGTEAATTQPPFGGPYSMQQMDAALPVSGGPMERVDTSDGGLSQQLPQQYNNATTESNVNFPKVGATDQSQLGYPSSQIAAPPSAYAAGATSVPSQQSYQNDQSQVAGHPAMPGPSTPAYTTLPDPPSHEPNPVAAPSTSRQGATRTNENQLILFD